MLACRPRLFHPVSCRSPYHRPNSKVSPFEIWTDAASAENAFRSGLVTLENGPRPPNAAVDSIAIGPLQSERPSATTSFKLTTNVPSPCAKICSTLTCTSSPATKNTTRSPTPRQRSSIPDFRKAGRCLANARQDHLAIFSMTECPALTHPWPLASLSSRAVQRVRRRAAATAALSLFGNWTKRPPHLKNSTQSILEPSTAARLFRFGWP
jgi:hypothetical protein